MTLRLTAEAAFWTWHTFLMPGRNPPSMDFYPDTVARRWEAIALAAEMSAHAVMGMEVRDMKPGHLYIARWDSVRDPVVAWYEDGGYRYLEMHPDGMVCTVFIPNDEPPNLIFPLPFTKSPETEERQAKVDPYHDKYKRT